MRILQLITRDQLRGAEMFARKLSMQLASRGQAVTLVALLASEPALEPPDGADFVSLHGVAGERGVSPSLVLRLARLFRNTSPDIIQANGSATLKYSVIARELSRRDTPLVYRNISMLSHWGRDPLRRGAVRSLLRRVDRVASVSEASREDLLVASGLSPERIVTILRGVEIPAEIDREKARTQIATLTGRSDRGPLLFHIGSLTPEKNHEGLLEIFRRVRAKVPDAHLVLLGDGPLRAQIEARVKEMGLQDCVSFLGARPDAPDLLAAAELLLLPSHVEGIPGAMLEAGAVGVPSVAYDVGGVRELAHGEHLGTVIRYDDVDEFASAVVDLLSDEETRTRLGQEARQDVCAHHSLAQSTDAFEALYLELIEEKRRTSGQGSASRQASG